MTYVLVCTRGPKKGSRWALTSKGVKIGRANSCEIQVADISAELFHCIVKLVDGKPVVQNMASDTGVDVNGARVEEAQLKSMDSIRVGNTKFIVLASGGRRRGLGARIAAALGLMAASIALAFAFLRQQEPKMDVSPAPAEEAVATNRVVQLVEVVTTNRVITVVNNVTITNYVVEVWVNGVRKSSKILDEPPDEFKEPAPVPTPPMPDPVPAPVVSNTPPRVAPKPADTEPKPYAVITSAQALAMGGAYGGDEVRLMPGAQNEIIHVFTEAAKTKTLVVPSGNKIVPGSVRIFVVGGGGAGGHDYGGGGGAGGVVEEKGLTFPVGTSYVYVGEGGGGEPFGNNGEDSLLTIGGTTYTAIGGGAGGTYCTQVRVGFAGGSGGGGPHLAKGGKALQPGTKTGGVGFDGGAGNHTWVGGGGGGAGGRGIDAPRVGAGGKGGGGVESSISGVSVRYANGGIGNGGNNPRAGAVNTGSGGDATCGNGFESWACGKKGGSGIVVVRYATKGVVRTAVGKTPEVSFPRPDNRVRVCIINGVKWLYFVEGGSATIGCHGAGSLDHPDLWIPAVDTNALSGIVRIPSRIGGWPVKKIGKGAFQGCDNVTRFIVPKGVTRCEARAFARCARLNAVVYPGSLEWLGEGQVYRSPEVKAIAFQGPLPKSDFAQCPFKGCALGAQLAIPYSIRPQWRNAGDMDPYLCTDGCHSLRVKVNFSEAERSLAQKTHAGFIRVGYPPRSWRNDGDLRKLCDDVWRRTDRNGADGQCLFMPDVYNIITPSNQNVVVYATMMFFKAEEVVKFKALINRKGVLLVDDKIVVDVSRVLTPWATWCNGECSVENTGWHRVAILMAWDSPSHRLPAPGISYGGESGGAFFMRSGDKTWQRFEATPDGETFRVTPEDVRRVLADLDQSQARVENEKGGGSAGTPASKRPSTTLGASLKSGLVGYWPFDGNANDASGARNYGVPIGVTRTVDRFGKANKAYHFDGKSYVKVPDAPSLRNITEAFTISAWINPHEWYGVSGWAPIMQKGDRKDAQYQLEVSSPGRVSCGLMLVDGKRHFITMEGVRGLGLGKWQHIALTKDSSRMVLFLNGQMMHTLKSDGRLIQNSHSLFIGYDPVEYIEYFIGDMDDVRLYNRALSEKEVQELYKTEAEK